MINMKNLSLSGLALTLMAPNASPLSAREPVVAIPQPPMASPHRRVLPLQGGQNFRDLGGYRAEGGRTVRWGLLYRSGSMHNLTAADYGNLDKLGIRAVCDFRAREERQVEPANWPAGKAPRMLADDYSMKTMSGGNFDLTKITPAAQPHWLSGRSSRARLPSSKTQVHRVESGSHWTDSIPPMPRSTARTAPRLVSHDPHRP